MKTNSAFWTHDGANYMVRVDHVSAVYTEQHVKGEYFLSFILSNGQCTRNKYATQKNLDEALALFHAFVNSL